MGFGKLFRQVTGAVVGAVGGFFIGGPVGAVVGAGAGWMMGDSAQKSADAVRQQESALEQAKIAQEQNLKMQAEQNALAEKARQDALKLATSQKESSEQAINAVNRKAPDIGGILANAAEPSAGGTMLTGPSGVDIGNLNLAKKSLLGG